jgi:hypothetical protein
VAYDSTHHRYLVVWIDERKRDVRGRDIYGRLFTADGTPVRGAFRISGPAATGDEFEPAVAYDPTHDQYLVVWRDDRRSGTRGWDLYGQRLTATGRRTSGNFRISGPGATDHEYAPAVAYNSVHRQFLVVWEDTRDYGTRHRDVFGRRIKAGGTPAGDDFRISGPSATEEDQAPAVTFNTTHRQFLVVWADARTTQAQIRGRRIRAAGIPAGGDFRISGPEAGIGSWPAVTTNPIHDQYLIAWVDDRNAGERGLDVYARRIKAGGSPAGGDFRISSAGATADEYDPEVAFDTTSLRYVAVWADERKTSTRGWEIYGRVIGPDGSPAGGDFRISGRLAIAEESTPAVAANPTHRQFLTVWTDARHLAADGMEVFGRRVRTSGTPVGGDFPIS